MTATSSSRDSTSSVSIMRSSFWMLDNVSVMISMPDGAWEIMTEVCETSGVKTFWISSGELCFSWTSWVTTLSSGELGAPACSISTFWDRARADGRILITEPASTVVKPCTSSTDSNTR
ncbi:MAG: hypothetical protein ACD_75C01166G0001 [uncultured bacterium]|nr:MAG: hypothetical protein ACD_75C01166G0001 [uncultured bacterium]